MRPLNLGPEDNTASIGAKFPQSLGRQSEPAAALPIHAACHGQGPTVLIASTTWWASPSRLAMAFAALGHRVEVICPAHHPLLKTSAVHRRYRYRPYRPLSGLAKAIAQAEPALIIPCDDRAVLHLHQLQAQAAAQGSPLAGVIARSLGDPRHYAAVDCRSALIAAARAAGAGAPDMAVVATPDQLADALHRVGLPAVVKVDGTWGGFGVEYVTTPKQAEAAIARLSRPLGAIRAFKRLIVNRDPFSILPWLHREKPLANLQAFVTGRPANCAVACWQGEVLARISCEVISARGETGNSTVVRVVDSPQMAEAAQRIVRHLGLSGFHGFDFLIDGAGAAHLLELNPRGTPSCHLALGPGADLVAALSARLYGTPPSPRNRDAQSDIIAFFPQAWFLDPSSTALHTGFHDVPWEDPVLVRELTKAAWPDRGVLVRLSNWLRVGRKARPHAS